MPGPTTFAALLRGINVGGRNTVPMDELATLFRSLGHERVTTYLRSGNVAFRSRSGAATPVAAALESGIAEQLGLGVRVLLRTHAELVEVAAGDPYASTGAAGNRRHVVFLDRVPATEAAANLDPDCAPGEAFHLAGREIYLHLPHGAGRTKLTLDYFERRLDRVGTARNWNTLLELIRLTST